MAGIKARAKATGDVVQIKALMSHPMETGQRKDSKTGEKIPAHYIKEVSVEFGGEVLVKANWGPAVSKNPYLSVKVKGPKAGDTVSLSWIDNKGESATGEVTVK